MTGDGRDRSYGPIPAARLVAATPRP